MGGTDQNPSRPFIASCENLVAVYRSVFVRLPFHVVANMPLFPEVICHAGPALRGMLTLLRQIMHIFRALHVGRSGAGYIHYIRQTFGIVQKWARA